jgi:hypothetical protein
MPCCGEAAEERHLLPVLAIVTEVVTKTRRSAPEDSKRITRQPPHTTSMGSTWRAVSWQGSSAISPKSSPFVATTPTLWLCNQRGQCCVSCK